VHGLMLDWQRFTSDRALDFFIAESAPLRAITPNIPLTTNFMQPDVGLNYWKFAEQVDVVAWDSYPRWHQTDDVNTAMQTAFYHDLHRSYKRGQAFLLLESTPSVTNWQGVSRAKKPGAHKVTSLQAVAHGSNSVQYFQWRQSRGGAEKFHGAVVSHLNTDDTRVFRDVVEVGRVLESLNEIPQTTVQAEAAIIYDFENGWALDQAQLPRSLNKNYLETCQRHYKPLWQRGVSTDIINAEADLSGYRLVVAPMLYMLRPGVAERIEAFVKAGGVLVTTYLSGMVNESDLTFINGYPAAFRRTLGIYSEELDTLADQQSGQINPTDGNALGLAGDYTFHHYAELVHPETAQVLAVYNSEFYASYPALTINNYGAGQAYYIAARTDDSFLADTYAGVLRAAGIEGSNTSPLPAGVSAQVREKDDSRYIFLMNFTDREQHIEIGDGLIDAITGTALQPTMILKPWDVSIVVEEKIEYPA
jgi:beta-galactosidase